MGLFQFIPAMLHDDGRSPLRAARTLKAHYVQAANAPGRCLVKIVDIMGRIHQMGDILEISSPSMWASTLPYDYVRQTIASVDSDRTDVLVITCDSYDSAVLDDFRIKDATLAIRDDPAQLKKRMEPYPTDYLVYDEYIRFTDVRGQEYRGPIEFERLISHSNRRARKPICRYMQIKCRDHLKEDIANHGDAIFPPHLTVVLDMGQPEIEVITRNRSYTLDRRSVSVTQPCEYAMLKTGDTDYKLTYVTAQNASRGDHEQHTVPTWMTMQPEGDISSAMWANHFSNHWDDRDAIIPVAAAAAAPGATACTITIVSVDTDTIPLMVSYLWQAMRADDRKSATEPRKIHPYFKPIPVGGSKISAYVCITTVYKHIMDRLSRFVQPHDLFNPKYAILMFLAAFKTDFFKPDYVTSNIEGIRQTWIGMHYNRINPVLEKVPGAQNVEGVTNLWYWTLGWQKHFFVTTNRGTARTGELVRVTHERTQHVLPKEIHIAANEMGAINVEQYDDVDTVIDVDVEEEEMEVEVEEILDMSLWTTASSQSRMIL